MQKVVSSTRHPAMGRGVRNSSITTVQLAQLSGPQPRYRADAAEPALPGRWRRPLEGERRRRCGGGSHQCAPASSTAGCDARRGALSQTSAVSATNSTDDSQNRSVAAMVKAC